MDAPSTRNSTRLTPLVAVAFAVSVTVRCTVPLGGELSETVGGGGAGGVAGGLLPPYPPPPPPQADIATQMIAAATDLKMLDHSNERMSVPLRALVMRAAKYANTDTHFEHRLHAYLRKVSG
jgi:hypothetical protein